jgi:DNA end-binding protein Ku
VSRKELAPSKIPLTEKELEMAGALVSAMSTTFKPEDYKDDYIKALKELIEAKLKGIEIKVPKTPKPEITDLMAALKASIDDAQKRAAKREAAIA